MNELDEYALLADLAKLLRKYGPDVFESLAGRLMQPEFSHSLARLLSRATSISRKAGKNAAAPQRQDLRSSILELSEREPQKGRLLLRLYENLNSGAALPSLRDIRDFAETNGLPVVKAKSRKQAIVSFVKPFLDLPAEEIQVYLHRMEPAPDQSDRSLEGWSNIILGGKKQREANPKTNPSRGPADSTSPKADTEINPSGT